MLAELLVYIAGPILDLSFDEIKEDCIPNYKRITDEKDI